MTNTEKINKALEYARMGQVDGSHHKAWAIDQMVRVLTDCPEIDYIGKDYKGQRYTCKIQGESEEYKKFVNEYQCGTPEEIASGEMTGDPDYEWDKGTPP